MQGMKREVVRVECEASVVVSSVVASGRCLCVVAKEAKGRNKWWSEEEGVEMSEQTLRKRACRCVPVRSRSAKCAELLVAAGRPLTGAWVENRLLGGE